jgi:hypothetical protein
MYPRRIQTCTDLLRGLSPGLRRKTRKAWIPRPFIRRIKSCKQSPALASSCKSPWRFWAFRIGASEYCGRFRKTARPSVARLTLPLRGVELITSRRVQQVRMMPSGTPVPIVASAPVTPPVALCTLATCHGLCSAHVPLHFVRIDAAGAGFLVEARLTHVERKSDLRHRPEP